MAVEEIVIRPTTPLTPIERGRLQRWLGSLPGRSVDAARRIRYDGSEFAVQADEDGAHEVAMVAMIVIGRPFLYTLAQVQRQLDPATAA